MKIEGIVIGDIHFGINETSRLYDELNELLIKDITENDYDYIILNGDTFDKKIHLNDFSATLAISFMSELMEISAKKKIKVRIIHGTKTHDLNQLMIYQHYMRNPKYNVDIIMNVKEEELFEGFNVLFIPEESLKDQFEYYKDYKTPNRYDMIFGHGTWSSQAFSNQIENDKDTKISSSPVLIENEWFPTLKENGKIIFGHIHVRYIHPSGKLIYPGAFTSWCHGHGNKKGYVRIAHTDDETNITFVDNKLTPTYETVTIDADGLTLEGLVENIENIKSSADRVSLKISNIGKEYSRIITKNYSKNDELTFNFSTVDVLNESQEESEEMTEFVEKYSYILKNKVSVEEMVHQFLKEDMNVEISLDFIKESLKVVGE